jgi:hypothetical protein
MNGKMERYNVRPDRHQCSLYIDHEDAFSLASYYGGAKTNPIFISLKKGESIK